MGSLIYFNDFRSVKKNKIKNKWEFLGLVEFEPPFINVPPKKIKDMPKNTKNTIFICVGH